MYDRFGSYDSRKRFTDTSLSKNPKVVAENMKQYAASESLAVHSIAISLLRIANSLENIERMLNEKE